MQNELSHQSHSHFPTTQNSECDSLVGSNPNAVNGCESSLQMENSSNGKSDGLCVPDTHNEEINEENHNCEEIVNDECGSNEDESDSEDENKNQQVNPEEKNKTKTNEVCDLHSSEESDIGIHTFPSISTTMQLTSLSKRISFNQTFLSKWNNRYE
jgi:hypothetical protein